MAYFISQAGGEKNLEKRLGTPLNSLKEDLRSQIEEQLLIDKMKNTIFKDVVISNKEIREYFNRLNKDSIPFVPTEVQVGQIIKYPIININEKEIVREKLLYLRKEIIEGRDFGESAKNTSEDYATRSAGGDIGWASRGDLDPEFESTALNLEKGEISLPIETSFGIHIIQLLDRKGNKFHTRHILIQPQASKEDIDNTIKFMDSVREEVMSNRIDFEEAVQEHSDDRITRSNLGYFQDNETRNNFINTDKLDPVIFFIIDTLKVGTLSNPMIFRTPENRRAIRLIFYKDHKESHFLSLEKDYEKVSQRALGTKKIDIFTKWIKNLLGELYLNIDDDYKYCNVLGTF